MEKIAFDSPMAQTAFAALGHEGRLAVFRLLMRFAPHPVRPSEMAAALDLKANTLSGYLSDLTKAGLIHAKRDGRSLYYQVDLAACEGLVGYLVNDCCRGRPEICPQEASLSHTSPYRVLFLCSGNSARSIMAESILNTLGKGRFVAYSAGTRPNGAVHPMTLALLERNGHDITGLTSKDIATFQTEDTPAFDFVFTVCDLAASEECAPWIGQPLSAHWGLPDPVKVTGTEAEKALAFAQTYSQLFHRIKAFVALDDNRRIDGLSRLSLQAQIDQISES